MMLSNLEVEVWSYWGCVCGCVWQCAPVCVCVCVCVCVHAAWSHDRERGE